MPNIKNISSLRQYTAVLDEVEKGSPVFLTREGRGRYAIMDIEEYDALRDALWGRLFDELDDARAEAEHTGWGTLDDARQALHGAG